MMARVMKDSPDVDAYLAEADGWPAEIEALRPILVGAGLTEEIKWGKPCYTHDGRNVVILQEMKDFLAVMFFKGALLEDPAGVLREQGPNSRSAKRIELASVEDVRRLSETVRMYVHEAIDVEEAGLEVGPPSQPSLVEELRERIEADPAFRAGFESLTPGRQREYNLYVSGAKQASTRASRVEKYAEKILEGKGLRDR